MFRTLFMLICDYIHNSFCILIWWRLFCKIWPNFSSWLMLHKYMLFMCHQICLQLIFSYTFFYYPILNLKSVGLQFVCFFQNSIHNGVYPGHLWSLWILISLVAGVHFSGFKVPYDLVTKLMPWMPGYVTVSIFPYF